MKRKFLDNNSLRHTLPFAAACFTASIVLFACADKDVEANDNNGKALVAFNVSETQDQAQAGAKSYGPISRAAFANQLALQNLAPEDLTMQKLPVQGAAASSDICLIETTVAGVPSQWEDGAPTRANITTMPTMQNFSTTAFYGSSDASLEPWFYDKDTKKDGTLVTPIYWDWIKNHACFYAVYPKPDNNKLKLSPVSYAGTPYVDFEVEPNVRNQKDLMTACSGNVHTTIDQMSATAPRTDLTFRHALAAVRFKVGQNLSWNKTITKVEIVNALSKGRYTLPTDKNHTGAWDASTLSAPATFTLGGDGTVNVSTSEAVNNVIMGHNQDNYVFYMIPQPLTGVSVNIYFNNATTPSLSIPLKGSWKPGTTKTYALSQNTSTWQYELTVTGPSPAEYSATSTGNYKIQSYRQDGAVQQPVPWKVVGYDTDGDGTFSMTEPLPSWFKGISTTSGDGSIGATGETGTASLVAATLSDKLAEYNAALKQNPKGSYYGRYDLSTHDVKGNSIARSTANCYVISHPGYYKIPLVYGNAILRGSTNPSAYNSGTTMNGFLSVFKDYNNTNITGPWIPSYGIDDAKVVWADTPNLVHFDGNPIVSNGSETFVQFEVKESDIQNGNAVIAVTRWGTVVWSWHLWFAADDVLNPVTLTNRDGKSYQYSKETLGTKFTAWNNTDYTTPRSVKVKVEQTIVNGGTAKEGVITITQNPGNTRQAFNTLYQWGRKDAFPGTNAIVEGGITTDGGNKMTLRNAIQHPETLYATGYNWDYHIEDCSDVNLWSIFNTRNDKNYQDTRKTVYDPSPAGYEVPPVKATKELKYNPSNKLTWSNGWIVTNSAGESAYFPAAGYRDQDNGLNIVYPTFGMFWSAGPFYNWGTAYTCLEFSQGSWDGPSHAKEACGLSVHPVVDNN